MKRTSYEFIRGGLNNDRENGTYCCLKLRSNVIGHSYIAKAFGDDTEKSAIENALLTLKEISEELRSRLENYNK